MCGRFDSAHAGTLIVSVNSPVWLVRISRSTSKPTRCAPTPSRTGVIAGRYCQRTTTVVPGGPLDGVNVAMRYANESATARRSEEHTSELQSRLHLVCRLLLEKKKKTLRR